MKDGKTLMLHRNKREGDMHEGKYVGLGGKFKDGESPEECIIREVYEESGLWIEKPIMKGILTFKGEMEEDWYVITFIAKDFSGDLKENHEGSLGWVDDDKLLDLPLWESDQHFIKWLKQEKFFSGKFTYEEGKLVKTDVEFY